MSRRNRIIDWDEVERISSAASSFFECHPDGQRFIGEVRQGFLSDAKAGISGAARWVLWGAAADLKRGKPLANEVAQFLADALLRAVAQPKSAGRALGLVAKRSRPRVDPVMDYQVARRFEELRSEGLKRGSNDANDDGSAIAQVGKEFKKSARTIRRCLERNAKMHEEFAVDMDRAIAHAKANKSID